MEGSKKGLFDSLGRHKYVMAALIALGAVLIAAGLISSKDGSSGDALTKYERSLEERVEQMCLCVEGIEKARVLVTVDADVGENASRYYAEQRAPAVRGVAAVVTGGADPAVRRTVTELIASSLGIPTSRVSVAEYK